MGELVKGPWRARKESSVADLIVTGGVPGLKMKNGGSLIDGTDAVLPDGRAISGHGYTRTTGQWRESMRDDGTWGYEVELYCLKSGRRKFVKASAMEGFFKIEDLSG